MRIFRTNQLSHQFERSLSNANSVIQIVWKASVAKIQTLSLPSQRLTRSSSKKKKKTASLVSPLFLSS